MGKFAVNDRVMAKWPKSSLWFEGTVVDLNDIEYQIRFNDEGRSEFVLKHRDVKVRNGKNYLVLLSIFGFILTSPSNYSTVLHIQLIQLILALS